MTANTILEAFVEDDEVIVELEIAEDALDEFPGLREAATRMNPLPVSIPEGAGLDLHADGTPLQGMIERIQRRNKVIRDEITGEPVGDKPEEPVWFVVLRYDLRDRPKTLVVTPPSRDGRATADIGFVIHHRGIAVNDFRYLAALLKSSSIGTTPSTRRSSEGTSNADSVLR